MKAAPAIAKIIGSIVSIRHGGHLWRRRAPSNLEAYWATSATLIQGFSYSSDGAATGSRRIQACQGALSQASAPPNGGGPARILAAAGPGAYPASCPPVTPEKAQDLSHHHQR